MKVSDVARKLQISGGTVRRYIKLGKLKATLILSGETQQCNSWYITDEQLEDYLKQYND